MGNDARHMALRTKYRVVRNWNTSSCNYQTPEEHGKSRWRNSDLKHSGMWRDPKKLVLLPCYHVLGAQQR